MEIDNLQMTGEVDIEGKYSIMLHKVDNVPCICVHQCEELDGWHYTKANEDSLVCAIPAKKVVELCREFYKI